MMNWTKEDEALLLQFKTELTVMGMVCQSVEGTDCLMLPLRDFEVLVSANRDLYLDNARLTAAERRSRKNLERLCIIAALLIVSFTLLILLRGAQ